jgi:hypothetical protein
MRDFFFHLGIACLCTHEIDAMPNHEWRVLPLLNGLPDDVGMLVFVAGHVPLFAAIFASVSSLQPRTRKLSRVAICVFLLLHGVGHWLFVGQSSYEFSSMLSNMLIFGGATFGALFLVLEWRERSAIQQ